LLGASNEDENGSEVGIAVAFPLLLAYSRYVVETGVGPLMRKFEGDEKWKIEKA
jgi:hypothetical protein